MPAGAYGFVLSRILVEKAAECLGRCWPVFNSSSLMTGEKRQAPSAGGLGARDTLWGWWQLGSGRLEWTGVEIRFYSVVKTTGFLGGLDMSCEKRIVKMLGRFWT